MFFRKSKLIQKLTAEILRLRDLLARTEGEREAYREMARRGVELLNERPKATVIKVETKEGTPTDLSRLVRSEYLPNYQAPDVKNCPECSVSVRASDWPQECPACHCLFGFAET